MSKKRKKNNFEKFGEISFRLSFITFGLLFMIAGAKHFAFLPDISVVGFWEHIYHLGLAVLMILYFAENYLFYGIKLIVDFITKRKKTSKVVRTKHGGSVKRRKKRKR